jgi:DNA repair protein RadC
MTSIKHMPKIKQPRERLKLLGLSNLTEIELVSLILGSGGKGENVLTRSRRLLHTYSLEKLSSLSVEDLTKHTTVGTVQAGKLLAGIELGRRIFQTNVSSIVSPDDVIHMLADIRFKSQEYLVCLYLNARHELLDRQHVAIGTLNQAVIEPRDILHYAVKLPASFIILAHNHPSGNSSPSEEDKQLTTRVQQAAALLGIMLVDHIIIATDGYTSFREEQLL